MYRVICALAACGAVLFGGFAAQAGQKSSAPDWGGLYVGAHGGYAWGDMDYPGTNPYIAPPAACGNCGSPRPHLEGGLVGGQVGFLYQLSKELVVGAEADISAANLEQTVRDGNYLTQTRTIDQFGSVRGRLGFAMGDFLPYATAGWGWANASLEQACPGDSAAVAFGHCRPAAAGGFGAYDLSKSETETGWVYGGGVETKISKYWTLRAEYLRYDFGKQSYELGTAPSGKIVPTKVVDQNLDVVRFAVNYKLAP